MGMGSPSSRERRQDASPSPQPSPTPDADEPSFPSSREPIPGPGPAKADLTVIPAEAGIQGEDGDEADDPESTDPQHGCYDIDRKIADAQRDPSHSIHKFVQAYDEVAAAFHGDDNEVRYWISGEVPDSYGKYIWEYAPAYPRSIRRRLRPRRRRRSTPKAESVWMKRPTDKMREAGRPAAQTHTNLGLNPPRRPTGPSGANTSPDCLLPLLPLAGEGWDEGEAAADSGPRPVPHRLWHLPGLTAIDASLPG